MNSLKHLSNQELVNKLKKLVSQEKNLTPNVIEHLVEVERREPYLGKYKELDN